MKSIREYFWQLPRVIAGTAAVAMVAGSLSISDAARAGGTLRVGMTAADIPLSWGQPDQRPRRVCGEARDVRPGLDRQLSEPSIYRSFFKVGGATRQRGKTLPAGDPL